jgi:hypothetical protein
MEVYNPRNVDLTLDFKPRGGIRSTINVAEWNEQDIEDDKIDISA